MIKPKFKISDILPQKRLIAEKNKKPLKFTGFYNPGKIAIFRFNSIKNELIVLKDKI